MKLQGFAKFFSGYPLDEVIATIEELDQSELEIFHKRFGTNYDNNYSKELTKEERAKLYNAVSKVKRIYSTLIQYLFQGKDRKKLTYLGMIYNQFKSQKRSNTTSFRKL